MTFQGAAAKQMGLSPQTRANESAKGLYGGSSMKWRQHESHSLTHWQKSGTGMNGPKEQTERREQGEQGEQKEPKDQKE
uniref:HDC15394 n=1 Tax=Drosophila melanogaster TaxID=7227 RepID=Q6IJA9_DROME|nr:TPA_inf: HDC15394 [Drosophila melanogaster]